MITETLGGVFRIKVQRYTDHITVAIDVCVCMTDSSVRKETMEAGIIGKGMNWIGFTG